MEIAYLGYPRSYTGENRAQGAKNWPSYTYFVDMGSNWPIYVVFLALKRLLFIVLGLDIVTAVQVSLYISNTGQLGQFRPL